MIDVEPDHGAIGVEIDIEPFDNLPRLRARYALQLDIEAVRLRIIMQLHGSSSRKLRLRNALWIVVQLQLPFDARSNFSVVNQDRFRVTKLDVSNRFRSSCH